MKYAEGPTTEVDVFVDAPPERVWALVSDITVPARFSAELQSAEWIDDTHFRGRNRHDAIGEWETTSEVVRRDGSVFEWAVGGADSASASWRFTVAPEGAGTRLSQWMRIGPAPSGLSPAIEAMPDKEERIIERRLAEHRANMQATIDGIRDLAESES